MNQKWRYVYSTGCLKREGRSRVVSKRKDMELAGLSTLGVDRVMGTFMIPLECD